MDQQQWQLAHAMLVSTSRLNLPLASEVDICFVSIVVASFDFGRTHSTLVLFATRQRQGNSCGVTNTNGTACHCVIRNTIPVSLEDHIQSLLPNHTLDAIHNSEGTPDSTPQYLAYQWSLNDTSASIGNNYF
jgi:hypothetical protein